MSMFERLKRPFLTVETGEAYGPVRLEFDVHQQAGLLQALETLKCCEKSVQGLSWQWYWRDESDNLHFESLDSYQKKPDRPLRLGTLSVRNQKLYISLPSFKRACLAVPFFHQQLPASIARLSKADFINKVFALDERLPHGFTELFKDDELDEIVRNRILHYEKLHTDIENAESAEDALKLLSDYSKTEANKRLPYIERYEFHIEPVDDPEVVFLGFYIFLRSREVVAIRRWQGETGISLADVAEQTLSDVFGDVGLDLLD